MLGRALEYYVWLYDGYKWTLTFADPRVQHWLFMSSPLPTIALVLCYLLMVFTLPRLLHGWPAYQFRHAMIVYNGGMVALNAYIFGQLVMNAYAVGYSLVCQPVSFAPSGPEASIAAALWWFYFSKCLEFADSLFFIVRKKHRQLTFLHIYHHSTMFCFWWIGVKWVAGGSAIYGATLNSLVHVVMYGYYALSAAFPTWNFWWKKYITAMQMVQFCIAIYMGAVGLYVDCPFPKWMGYTLIAYMCSFLVLFSNFWSHAYKAGRKFTSSSRWSGAAGVAQNGSAAAAAPSPKEKYDKIAKTLSFADENGSLVQRPTAKRQMDDGGDVTDGVMQQQQRRSNRQRKA